MKKALFLFIGLLGFCVAAQAQRTLSGKVTDRAGQPLIGANVLVKGTTTGTITDVDGLYSLVLPAGASTLIVSYTGYRAEEVPIGDGNEIDVVLTEGALLEEVVVTALGLETRRSKVGTASTTVEGNALVRSGEVGLINSLAAKSAGINIVQSSGEPGAGARILIRGVSSITGNTQPLIVLDGIPILNDSYYGQGFGGEVPTNSGSLGSGGGVVQQSRLNDLNPEDIDRIEVLRGASAAAIWGSRAANGVLVITTKKGRNRGRDWSINFNTSLALDEVNKKIPLNEAYGPGRNMLYQFNPAGGTSWGDRIAERKGGEDAFITEGQPGYAGRFVSDQTGKTYYAVANGTPANPAGGKNSQELYDIYDYLFQTAPTFSNSLSLSQSGEAGSVYFSLAQLNQEGIIVGNSDYGRTTARLNAVRRIGQFALEANAGYTFSKSQRVQMGSNLNGLFLGGLREPVDFDSRDYEGAYIAPDGTEFPGRQRAYRNPLGAAVNSIYNSPAWTTHRVNSDNIVNRFIGKLELRYDPTTWLNVTARGGIDAYTDERDDYYPFFAAGENNQGRYTKETITRRQLTFDVFGRAYKTFSENFAGNVLVGLGLYEDKLDDHGATARSYVNPLSPPQLGNATNLVSFNFAQLQRTIGAYATVGLEFYQQLYLNLSARQDHLSTLPADDNTVFYPAADLSWRFSQLWTPGAFLNSGRLRAGVGQVGRGPSPYITQQVFFNPVAANTGWGEGWSPGIDPLAYGGGSALLTTAANADIRPEIKTEYEAGLDLGFFEDRISLSATYYYNVTKDLIINVRTPESVGFLQKVTNAAEIENRGLELEWTLVPWRRGDVDWSLYGNFTRNRNKVVKMAGTNNILLSGFAGTSSNAVLGEQLGVLFGTRWERAEDGALALDDNGFPILSASPGVIGDPNPDYRMGLGSTFSWKRLSLNVLFDFSQGGDIWNGTRGALAFFGRSANTAVETTLSAEQANALRIYDGRTVAEVYPHRVRTDGSYSVRGEVRDFGGGPVFLDEIWYRIGPGSGFTGPAEQDIEDASWARLRELTLSYTLNSPSVKWLDNATISFTGRNLFLWTDYTGNDPDTNLTGAGLNGLGLDYFQNPSSRTYRVTLNLNF